MAAVKGKFTWDDFRNIKFDKHYSKNASYAKNFGLAFQLDAAKYPNIADAILKLKNWNWGGEVDNKDAALVMLMQEQLVKKWKVPFAFLMIKKDPLTEPELVEAITHAKKWMLHKYETLDVKLGDVQHLIRGGVSLPASGLREVPRATDTKLFDKEKGLYRVGSGDGYIQMNRYSPTGVEILSINAYGASAHPESKHYTDQMVLFSQEKFKPMTFDESILEKEAEAKYHPGEKH
jgi:acyl-homoserine-lactone acylase